MHLWHNELELNITQNRQIFKLRFFIRTSKFWIEVHCS